jgi:hypothetical protein
MNRILVEIIDYQQFVNDVCSRFQVELSKITSLKIPDSPVVEELLTLKAAAALLGISLSTLHEHKRRGIYAFVKIGGRAYIHRSEVLAAGIRQQRSYKPARTKR